MSGPITADILDEIFVKKDIGLEADLNSLEKMLENSISNHEAIVGYFATQRIKLADDIDSYMKKFKETEHKASRNWSIFSNMIKNEQFVTDYLDNFLKILTDRLKVKFPNWFTEFINEETKKLDIELVDKYSELDKSRLEPQRKIRSKLIVEIPKLANEVLHELRTENGKIESDNVVLLETKIHQLETIDQLIVQVFREIFTRFDTFIAFAENHFLLMERRQVKFEDENANPSAIKMENYTHPKDIVYSRMGFNVFHDEVESVRAGNALPEKLVRAFLTALHEEYKPENGILLCSHDAFETILPYGNPLVPEFLQPIEKIKEQVNIEFLGHFERTIFPVCMGPRGWLIVEIRKTPLEEINIYDSNQDLYSHLHEKLGLVMRGFLAKIFDFFKKDGNLESKKFLIKSKRVPISPFPEENNLLFLKNLMLLCTKHELHPRSFSPEEIVKCRRRLCIFFSNASPDQAGKGLKKELLLNPWEI